MTHVSAGPVAVAGSNFATIPARWFLASSWSVRPAFPARKTGAAQNAGVQTMGDISFAVPDGWTYTAGPDYGAMVLKADKNYWVMAAYTPMVSSGDAERDLRIAWQRIVLAGRDYQGFPLLPYTTIAHTVGYPGKRADASSLNRATYTRLYVLEAGKSFIPVVAVSNDGMVLNTMEHIANVFLGSVRLAPLKASPVKSTLTLADMAGDWKSGLGNSINYLLHLHRPVHQGTSNSFTLARAITSPPTAHLPTG